MSDQRNDEALERRKQIRLKLRPDLESSRQLYEDKTYYVFKDPAGLRYHRYSEEEFFILQLLDGRNTLEDVRLAVERRFRPRRLPLEELEAFAQTLLKEGLIVSGSLHSGRQLYERRCRRVRGEWVRKLTNILSIEIPLCNPDPFLGRLLPYCRWLFTGWFVALSILAMLAALLLIGSHWNLFWRKLPSAQEFFRFQNLIWLWLAIGLVKILHEFGHGLTCKHYGGEVPALGLMFLCLSPCLYVNVSNAWTLPSKWQRIAVSAAGVWVELMIAGLSAFLWWNTTEQWLFHKLCLDLMVVCSVNTVLINGNPLLRYDGYFVLADWLEIPNLREDCNRYLKRLVMKQCLGMEVPEEPPMALLRRILFVIFAVASWIYGWMITFGMIVFLGDFLPYKLRILSQLLAVGSAASMLGWPTYHFFKGLHQRGWKPPKTEPKRVWATVSMVSVLLLLFFFLPLPVSRVRQRGVVQFRPEAVEPVHVPLSGTLEKVHVRDGAWARKGDLLAEFSSLEWEGQLKEADCQHKISLENLRTLPWLAEAVTEPQERARLDAQIAQADGERKLHLRQRDAYRKALDLLKVTAPRAGVVLNAPHQEEEGKLWEKDQGVPLCNLGDPSRLGALRVLVPVTPADFRVLQEDLAAGGSLEATIRVQGLGGDIWTGKVTMLPASAAQEVPPALTLRCGGPLAVKPGSKPGAFVPQNQHYLVSVDWDDGVNDGICPGAFAQVKIHSQWRSCAWWLWRGIAEFFEPGLI